MLQMTVDRLRKTKNVEDIFIVTGKHLEEKIKKTITTPWPRIALFSLLFEAYSKIEFQEPRSFQSNSALITYIFSVFSTSFND